MNKIFPPSLYSRAGVPVNWAVEAGAGVSTSLTMSYIFLLNPFTRSVGIDPSAAFFSTVVIAFLSTMAMGLYAKLPSAVAPVPTITTFFVFFVCGRMKIPWPEALTCVLASGLLSVVATVTSVRSQLIEGMPGGLKLTLMFAVGGFLVANGLNLAGMVTYHKSGMIEYNAFFHHVPSKGVIITLVGLAVAAIFNSRFFPIKTGPILGIAAAIVAAVELGVPIKKPHVDVTHVFSSVVHFSLPPPDWLHIGQFIIATLIFFLVDFYGAIGKIVALTQLSPSPEDRSAEVIRNALMVDSVAR